MQQQQHGGGGGGGGGGAAQQFGVQQVEMPPPFSPAGGAGQRISQAEAASPISSRPPAPAQQYDELGASGAGAGPGGFDAEGLEAAAAGEEGSSGGSAGNRWPRQETLALLKIRLDMDAAFRDATLKGPLWEQVSRKLAEQGYSRSAKKCKEKFENVYKYYKRTKESRAGRNDGKTYRFFTQLEALHGTGALAPAATPVASFAPTTTTVGVSGPSAVRVPAEPPPAVSAGVAGMAGTMGSMMSFSTSNTEEYSDDEDSDDECTEELGGRADERGKRKRLSEGGAAAAAGGSSSGKMMRFFEGLMKQVMERQEAMQQRFVEAIEKREQDRMIREEAWRRQEMARLAREQEILAQERAMAASRDAAVLSFIQKITGQTIPMPSIAAPAVNVMPPPLHPKPPPPQPHPTPIASASPAPPPSQPPASQPPPPQPQPSPQPQRSPMPATPQGPPPQQQSTDIVVTPAEAPHADAPGYDGSGGGATSSRWPKAEVHALIQLRSNLDTRYQDAGPKGPLWEEISSGMRRLGYNRNAKRCKEKWENINKYFKKVKESNKKRPEDSKTCPYFHQLDALYRNKAALSSSGVGAAVHANASSAPHEAVTVTAAAPISQTPPPQPSQSQRAAKNGGSSNAGTGNGNGGGAPDHGASGGGSGGMQMQASNGSVAGRFFGEGGCGGTASAAKKRTS
ncbi:trihelix transcription factor GTL1-like isoform X2 [Phragmites australis]|uniref:trihelix transcription factor GTL1-like isoform X2 n=1 Tax=Phragmites australis TaxID=29695 RepID=UPI002D774CAB|nr:trihelix transcription factor GTL1-like isoform X2 [Phragmites australis]